MIDKPISPLRQRMIDDMTARRFKEKVQKDYIRHVRTFAAFLGRSPDTATSEDLRPQRRPGRLLEQARPKQLARKSKPPLPITKIRSMIASLWIAPSGNPPNCLCVRRTRTAPKLGLEGGVYAPARTFYEGRHEGDAGTSWEMNR